MNIPLVQFDELREGQPAGLSLLSRADVSTCGVPVMREAQRRWAAQPVAQRLTVVRRARHEIADRAEWLASVSGRGSNSRLMAEALSAQVLPLADACRYLEREAASILAPRRLGAWRRPGWLRGVSSIVYREALGVVLVVAPSNYPLFLPGVTALQALAAGNAVLIKPGPGGADAMHALEQILHSAGLDKELLCILPESPDAVLGAIRDGVDKVVFTGSARTGASVLQHLAPHFVPATLELSGCDAVFVREDADLDLVVRALAFGLRLNGGATCIGPRRVFVHRAKATELEGRLAAALPVQASAWMPRRVQEQLLVPVLEALQDGAHLITGKVADGRLAGPLVLAGASPEMRLLRDDFFAPVLSLVTVSDQAEALHLSAQCPFALGATVFGRDEAACATLAGQVQAGVVVINDMIVPTADPRLPFGGRKRSGFGVTRGRDGLLEMTAPKVVAVRRGRSRPHLEPARDGDAALFQGYLQLVHGCGWAKRMRGLLQLVRCLSRRVLGAARPERRTKTLSNSIEIL